MITAVLGVCDGCGCVIKDPPIHEMVCPAVIAALIERRYQADLEINRGTDW